MPQWVRPSFLAALFSCLLGGCSSKSAVQEESAEGKHLRKVADLCLEYSVAKKKSPSRMDEVKEWAIKEGKASEDDFLSTRDHQVYGMVALPMGGQYMVYEQSGKGGKCYMITMGKIVELPKDDLEKQVESFKSVRPGRGRGGERGGASTK